MTRYDYFLSSNSCEGYVSFYQDNLKNIKLLHKLVNTDISKLVEKFIQLAEEQNLSFEVIHNCLDLKPCGILFPEERAGIINITTNTVCREEAYKIFAEAKKIHDDLEKIYIENTDFSVLDSLANEFCSALFDKKTKKKGIEKNRFFGAATAKGAVDFIDNLTKNIEKRYLIKGRAGTGKSGFLKKIAFDAISKGYDTEIYHCAFDPKSVDMVIIKDAGVCFFDSTAPHEYFPSRKNDEVLDFYTLAVRLDTDLVYKSQIDALKLQYAKKMKDATKILSECAKQKPKELENSELLEIYTSFEKILK